MCDVPISSLNICTTCRAFASESRGPIPKAGMTCRLQPEIWTAQYQSPFGSRGIGRGLATDILVLHRVPDASVYIQTSDAMGRRMERRRLSRIANCSSAFNLGMRGILRYGLAPTPHALRISGCNLSSVPPAALYLSEGLRPAGPPYTLSRLRFALRSVRVIHSLRSWSTARSPGVRTASARQMTRGRDE